MNWGLANAHLVICLQHSSSSKLGMGSKPYRQDVRYLTACEHDDEETAWEADVDAGDQDKLDKLRRVGQIAADAEVFIKMLNKNMHKNKLKELEIQVIGSSLLLGVAGAGLFATPDLEPSFWKNCTIVFSCVAVFCFMSAALISSALILPFLSGRVTTQVINKALTRLYFLPVLCEPRTQPQASPLSSPLSPLIADLAFGYFSLVGAAIVFFLCMWSRSTSRSATSPSAQPRQSCLHVTSCTSWPC
jgi:hypothetical protein